MSNVVHCPRTRALSRRGGVRAAWRPQDARHGRAVDRRAHLHGPDARLGRPLAEAGLLTEFWKHLDLGAGFAVLTSASLEGKEEKLASTNERWSYASMKEPCASLSGTPPLCVAVLAFTQYLFRLKPLTSQTSAHVPAG